MSKNLEGSDKFVINQELREVIYLRDKTGKPIGGFCALPGCTKRLKGKMITRKNWRTGKIQTFEMPILKTQRYCCDSHKTKAYDIRNKVTDKRSKTSIDSRIKLLIEYDNLGAYREITLYLISQHRIVLKIRPTDKDLWDTLDKILYYRRTHPNEKIKPMNLLSLVNLNV